jgi:glycosyltransferase involved in cell wall biosynthesis
MKAKIIFTTPVLEHPPAGGPALRIENSIKALAQVSELHLIVRADRQSIGGDSAERFYCRNCAAFGYTPSRAGVGDSDGELRNARAIARYAVQNGIQIVWCGYGNISHALMKELKRLEASLRVVCDTDSVWSSFVLRELPFETDPLRRREIELEGRAKEAEEAEWVSFCDVITAVSPVDAEYYRRLASSAGRIHLFSNVVDLDSYAHMPSPAVDLSRPCMYLSGSFYSTNSPMARAARWVISEVLPRVRQSIPDMRLYVVGNGAEKMLRGLEKPHVIIKGKVASVLPYLCHSDVALVPLMFESGTRFKILEAAACGIPIVSTTLGAEGLRVHHGSELLVADDPEAFAAAVVRLIQDREYARMLARNCRQVVRRHYGIESLKKEALKILDHLLCGHDSKAAASVLSDATGFGSFPLTF